MIIGVNRTVAHDGHDYHVQVEDLAPGAPVLEARVYEGGSVLWHRRVPYEELQARGLPKLEFEEALRTLMEKTVQTVTAAILKGKLG